MPTQRHYASSQRADILRQLKEEMLVMVNEAVDGMEQIITGLVDRTLKYKLQSGTNALADASVKFIRNVTINDQGALIRLTATVVDPSGQPHFIWHILSRGRPSYVQRKTSPPIKERYDRRTGRMLDSSPFPGYTGRTFVIPKGTRVKAVAANRWYNLIKSELIQQMKRDPLLKSFTITNSTIDEQV
jgi:hypothetical protein